MKIIQDPITERWLLNFNPVSEHFDWDSGNSTKNLKHGITKEQIESIFKRIYGFSGRIIEPEHQEWRGLILGQSYTGKLFALIFTIRGEKLRPISCRPMRSLEVKKYYENKKTEDHK